MSGSELVTTSPLRSLELEHFALTPTGLRIKGTPTYEEWAGIGEMLQMLERGVQWIIGDWLIYGEGTYGEKASQAIDVTGWSSETCRIYRWVAEKVPSENRFMSLSFNHHQEVAALPAAEQARWLERAVAGDGDGLAWPSTRLRTEIRSETKGTGTRLVYLLSVEFDSVADRDAVAGEHERVGRKVRRAEYTRPKELA